MNLKALSPRHWIAASVVILLLLLCGVLLLGLFVQAPTPPFIMETDIYKLSFGRLAASKGAEALLGSPVSKETFAFSGSIEEGVGSEAGKGSAKFSFKSSGPKGKGVLQVEAVKADGVWTFKILELQPYDAPALNLLLEGDARKN